jgi:hypothetical protein
MSRTTRGVALAAVLVTAIGLGAGSATASAATPTISDLPTTAPLVDKVYVPVSITVTCDPNPFFMFESASVTITQTVHKHVAHGTATNNSIVCDGAPHSYALNVFPDTGGGFPPASASPPFNKGTAVITAQVNGGSGSATAGPHPITLTK